MTKSEEITLLKVLGSRTYHLPNDVWEPIVDGIVVDLKELGWGDKSETYAHTKADGGSS